MSFLSKIKKNSFVRYVYKHPLVQRAYHFCLAFLGALIYGFPSRKMFVIGVTGTKGKTTTSNLIAHILNSAGIKTAMATTVNFRIGDAVWMNETKQTMLGRFALQKFLARALREGCVYAVVETSSEGVLQYRHRFIDYDMAVFTNLSPEHIERHGGFENYRSAKVELFKKIARKKDGRGVFNLDDENVKYFLSPSIEYKAGFVWKSYASFPDVEAERVSNVKCSAQGAEFFVGDMRYRTQLLGEFNVYNAASAIIAAKECGLDDVLISNVLSSAQGAPGRMEVIDSGKGFSVVVDYSYEPTGLTNALTTLKLFKPSRIIVLIGSAGGGRDTWRRPVMGEIAAKLADVVIVTTDDPYDENPDDIVRCVYEGAQKVGSKREGETLLAITDRKEALTHAIHMARQGDIILAAGKGGELWMNVKDGKVPWDEARIIRDIIETL